MVRNILLAGALVAVGCAAQTPAPTQQIAAAERAVMRAEQSGAARLSPTQLDLARRKLAEARELAAKGDAEEAGAARRLAEQAALDARLAETRSQSEKAQSAAQMLRRGIDPLPGEEPDAR